MKLLITGSLGAKEEDLEAIRALGHHITLHPDERVPVADPGQYEGIIGNSLFYYGGHEGYDKLRYLQITSVGLDRVPLDWVREQGIVLKNADGVYAPPMAEWTIMRILELLKQVPREMRRQLDGVYKKSWDWQELEGRQILMIGFGPYGREIARRLKPFGASLWVANRSLREDPHVDAFYPLSDLPHLLPQADIIILALALSNETRHILDRQRLLSLKAGALLINGARGALIDEEALIEALKNGPLRGAALDVFETEPLPADSPLWKLENVLLSPHNSFVGQENHRRMMEIVLRNLKEYSLGKH